MLTRQRERYKLTRLMSDLNQLNISILGQSRSRSNLLYTPVNLHLFHPYRILIHFLPGIRATAASSPARRRGVSASTSCQSMARPAAAVTTGHCQDPQTNQRGKRRASSAMRASILPHRRLISRDTRGINTIRTNMLMKTFWRGWNLITTGGLTLTITLHLVWAFLCIT